MKIVFSRKGFDSGSGGGASPILPDGRMISLPIPDYRGDTRYRDIQHDVDIWKLVGDLSQGRYLGGNKAHLDPDLHEPALPRQKGWRGAFGQTSSAASHLLNQKVGIDDVFLFFGWFRDAELKDGRWRYAPKGRSIHVLFGWLQIAEMLSLATGEPAVWQERHPWLQSHPHVKRGAEALNHIFVGQTLMQRVSGLEDIKGYGVFPQIDEKLILTKLGSKNRSVWLVPDWFHAAHGSPLSYHVDPARWAKSDHGYDLSVVGRGQEFVLDCSTRPQAQNYFNNLLRAPASSPSL
jgi:hypothetical protein